MAELIRALASEVIVVEGGIHHILQDSLTPSFLFPPLCRTVCLLRILDTIQYVIVLTLQLFMQSSLAHVARHGLLFERIVVNVFLLHSGGQTVQEYVVVLVNQLQLPLPFSRQTSGALRLRGARIIHQMCRLTEATMVVFQVGPLELLHPQLVSHGVSEESSGLEGSGLCHVVQIRKSGSVQWISS